MDKALLRFAKRYGFLLVTLVFIPFVINRINTDADRDPVLVTLTLLLLAVCLAQAAAYALLRAEYSSLERRVSEAMPSTLMVNQALSRKTRPTDKDNRYTLIKAFAHIDAEGNYKAMYERHGVNQSRNAVDHIRVLTSADSYLEFDDLQVQANEIGGANAKLKVAVVEDDFHQKLFDIFFKKPVQPNERFAISYSFVWPRVMRSSGDYDFLILKDFERGVEHLTYILEFDKELASFRFEKITRNGDWEPLADGKESQNEAMYQYTLDLKNPDSDAYRFTYRG